MEVGEVVSLFLGHLLTEVDIGWERAIKDSEADEIRVDTIFLQLHVEGNEDGGNALESKATTAPAI